ncbi:RNA 2'-phosphotransferase [Brevibacillus parabrevis]|uniref:RNA 2'-phosphotransferase n=1 Tax=Brevibacillus parabrevis TaxID=54914 RepID=UPI0028D63143|nr:RNA 2'-phosphotransferase [Brevibacillus parabrevis]MED1725967.1 RNA 2'-phosphotransferase [Brevibacillus parabrevis]
MDLDKLSKELSYALRHAPHEYELELDENGWVDVQQLLEALREAKRWTEVKEEHLFQMIEASEKKRHEISGGKIRALYGHSVPQKISKEKKQPPEVLYHGTATRFVSSIMESGLLPKGRQYVHLSEDTETALQVGKRRDEKPVLLKIHAKKAWEEGTAFYFGNEKVWLADEISAKYITIC